MPYFALIIMFYHVKIACYQVTTRISTRIGLTGGFDLGEGVPLHY